jgi:hypothetical protein
MTKAPRQSGLGGSEANPHRGLCPMPPHWVGFVAVRVSGLTPFLSAPRSAWVQAPRQLTCRGYGTRRPTYPRSVYAYVDHAGREIDVVPDEAEQLRNAQAGVERRRNGSSQRPGLLRAAFRTEWQRRSVGVELVMALPDAGEAA